MKSPGRTSPISLRLRLRTLSIALLTIGGLLLAGGGAHAAAPAQYPALMKRLGSVPPGTTVPATARTLFPGNASDASAFRTMAGRVDSGPVARFAAAVAHCAAGRAGEAGVKRAAAQVGQGNRAAAEKAASAVVGTCINTAVPPIQRLPAEAAQRSLTDAVLWVELKMAAQ